MVPFRKRLKGEVGEDRGQPLGHSSVVVRVAAPTEREIDRFIECPKRVEVELAAVERGNERAQARGSLDHPRRRWAVRTRRWLDPGGQLQPCEPRHELLLPAPQDRAREAFQLIACALGTRRGIDAASGMGGASAKLAD
jgi:hypothetical protein